MKSMTEKLVGIIIDLQKMNEEASATERLVISRLIKQTANLREDIHIFIKALEKDHPIIPDMHPIPEDVDELALSIRSANCLRNAGVRTTKDLISLKRSELLKMKNLGRKTFLEIKDSLAELGIKPPQW